MNLRSFFEKAVTNKDVQNFSIKECRYSQLKALSVFLLDKRIFRDFKMTNLLNVLRYDKDCLNLQERMDKIKNLGKNSSSLNCFILRYGEIEGYRLFKIKGQKCSITTEQAIKKYGENGREILRKMRASVSLDIMIERYGEEKGKEKWQSYLDKWKSVQTKEYFISKYGEEKGKEKWKKRKEIIKNANSEQGYIKKLGEEKGKLLWKTKYESAAYKNSTEYYKEKYPNDWKERIKKTKDSGSIEYFISKYGEVEGKEKYKQYCIKCRETAIKYEVVKHFGTGRYSKVSQKLFNSIYELIKDDYQEIIYGTLSKTEHNCFVQGMYYDFVILDNKKVIEFNGDYWHCNPIFHKEEDIINIIGKQIMVKDIWLKDKNKISKAEENGFSVLVVWENEYVNNEKETIKKCIKFIKDEK
jgi:very-short-patch-repair endonuclease